MLTKQNITGNINGNPTYLLPKKEREEISNLRANTKNRESQPQNVVSPISSIVTQEKTVLAKLKSNNNQINHYDTKKASHSPDDGKLVLNTDMKPSRKSFNNDLGSNYQSNKTLEPNRLQGSNSNDKIGNQSTLQKLKNSDYDQNSMQR